MTAGEAERLAKTGATDTKLKCVPPGVLSQCLSVYVQYLH